MTKKFYTKIIQIFVGIITVPLLNLKLKLFIFIYGELGLCVHVIIYHQPTAAQRLCLQGAYYQSIEGLNHVLIIWEGLQEMYFWNFSSLVSPVSG